MDVEENGPPEEGTPPDSNPTPNNRRLVVTALKTDVTAQVRRHAAEPAGPCSSEWPRGGRPGRLLTWSLLEPDFSLGGDRRNLYLLVLLQRHN